MSPHVIRRPAIRRTGTVGRITDARSGAAVAWPGFSGQNVTGPTTGGLLRRANLIQVAIVDDHPVARRGLQSILAEAGDIQVSAAVATPAELSLTGPGAVRPNVIMLDLYHDGDEPCLAAVA